MVFMLRAVEGSMCAKRRSASAQRRHGAHAAVPRAAPVAQRVVAAPAGRKHGDLRFRRGALRPVVARARAGTLARANCTALCGLRRPRCHHSGASSSSGITGERLTVSSTMDEVTSRTPADAQQPAHGEVRQRLDVAHDDVQQEIHLAGHGVAGEHFGPVDERAPKALDDLIGMLLELDLHDGLDGLARAFRVDDGRVSLDEPRSLRAAGSAARRAWPKDPPARPGPSR